MISFACKDIELMEIVRCSFDLNKTDYTVFNFLMGINNELAISEIASKLKLERSGVQKSIKTLLNQDLVMRRQLNLDHGGYKFRYSIKDKELVKKRMMVIIDGWHSKVKDAIKHWN